MSPSSSNTVVFLLLCLLLSFLPLPAEAQGIDPSTQSRVEEHLDRAKSLYQSKEYAAAIVELEAAYALHQWPRILYNMAQSYAGLGKAEKAAMLYRRYLQHSPDLGPEERARIEKKAKEMESLAAPLDPSPKPPQGSTRPTPPIVLPSPSPTQPRPVYSKAWFWATLATVAAAGVAATVVAVTVPGRASPPADIELLLTR